MEQLNILPLAITMMAGPQILTAAILIIGSKPVKNSLAFIAGVATAASIGVLITYSLAGILPDDFLHSDSISGVKSLQIIILVILVTLSVKTYLNRDNIKPPKWLNNLRNSSPGRVFKLALMLIFLMPTDVAAMFAVGLYLKSNDLSYFNLVPFVMLTAFIAALPLLIYLLFKKKFSDTDAIEKWINNHAWMINAFIYILFAYLIAS